MVLGSKLLFISHVTSALPTQDTAGQERYHALGPIYYRDSHGAVVVYDITDEDSFKKVGVIKRRSLFSGLLMCLLTVQWVRLGMLNFVTVCASGVTKFNTHKIQFRHHMYM